MPRYVFWVIYPAWNRTMNKQVIVKEPYREFPRARSRLLQMRGGVYNDEPLSRRPAWDAKLYIQRDDGELVERKIGRYDLRLPKYSPGDPQARTSWPRCAFEWKPGMTWKVFDPTVRAEVVENFLASAALRFMRVGGPPAGGSVSVRGGRLHDVLVVSHHYDKHGSRTDGPWMVVYHANTDIWRPGSFGGAKIPKVGSASCSALSGLLRQPSATILGNVQQMFSLLFYCNQMVLAATKPHPPSVVP
jgi:hypothetical protein